MFIFPRRLDNLSRDKRIVIKSWSGSNKSAGSSGIQGKLGEIRTDPSSKISVFRSYSGFTKYGAFPSPRQSFKNFRHMSGSPTLHECFSKETRKNSGVFEFCGQLSSPRKITPFALNDVDERQHFSKPKGCKGNSGQGPKGSLLSLGGSVFSDISSSYASPSSNNGTDDRCLPLRVERSPSTLQCQGGMASRSGRLFNKLEGTLCNFPVCNSFSKNLKGHVGQSADGQQNSHFMYSSSGIPSFPSSSGSIQGSAPVLPSSQNHPVCPASQRCAECVGRSSLKGGSDSDGMVSGPGVISNSLRGDRSSSSGPVCNKGKHPTLPVRIPLSRLKSPRLGCSEVGLEQVGKHLRFPTRPNSSRCSEKVKKVHRLGLCDCPLLDIPKLVPSPSGKVSKLGSPSRELVSVSTHKSGENVSQQPKCLQASRLDTIKTGLLRKKYSLPVIEIMLRKHRTSSAKQYQVPWNLFFNFLKDKNISHNSIGVPTVLSFLEDQRQLRNLKYRTLAAYRCGLKDPLFHSLGLDIDVQESRDFMMGLFNLITPNKSAPMPLWSLPKLLTYLKSSVFEPLDSCPWDKLIQKTLALMLLASGRRIGEITHISSQFSISGNSVILSWLPFFRAKRASESFTPDPPSILRMDGLIEPDNILCPVRAWEIFCERRSSIPSNSSGVSDAFWGKSVQSLTYLFNKLVYASLEDDDPKTFSVGPHQMRKLAVSYCWDYFISNADHKTKLAKLVGSYSFSVLKKVYVRDVPRMSVSCVVPLGTIKADI